MGKVWREPVTHYAQVMASEQYRGIRTEIIKALCRQWPFLESSKDWDEVTCKRCLALRDGRGSR